MSPVSNFLSVGDAGGDILNLTPAEAIIGKTSGFYLDVDANTNRIRGNDKLRDCV